MKFEIFKYCKILYDRFMLKCAFNKAFEDEKWLNERVLLTASLLSTFFSKTLDNTIMMVSTEFLFIY